MVVQARIGQASWLEALLLLADFITKYKLQP
jgi:hypothetical protein